MILGISQKTGRQSRSRLWWCPTGAFAALPLHAAGRYDADVACIAEYVVSSYTPTVSALYRARKKYRSEADRVVVLASNAEKCPQTTPPKHAGACKVLSMPNFTAGHIKAEVVRTRDTALDVLSGAAVLHSLSPPTVEPENICHSGFSFADGKLTLSDLMSLGAAAPQLSFVRCGGTPSSKPSDAFAMYAAMQQAGLRSIIGRLW